MPTRESGEEEESDESEDDGNDAARIVSQTFRAWISQKMLTGDRGTRQRS